MNLNGYENGNGNPMNAEGDTEGESVRRKFLHFLNECTVPSSERGQIYYYRQELATMIKMKRTTLSVDYIHLLNFDSELGEYININYYRFEPFLLKALQKFVSDLNKDYTRDKIFYLTFVNYPEIDSIRDLKSDKIGKLMALMGTITKTTEVRPELLFGTFSCGACGARVRDVQQQFKFTEPKMCTNPNCTNRFRWNLESAEGCQFTDWQKVRVQENSNDIPAGSMPRSVDVVLRNEQVEKAQPGDRCVFVGTLVVVPDAFSMMKPGEKFQLSPDFAGERTRNMAFNEGVTGLKSQGVRDLNYKMVFMATNVIHTESRFGTTVNIREDADDLHEMSYAEKQEIIEMKDSPDFYTKMARSICPMVYGNEEIKKGILLMLFGGINKTTMEQIKIRGDINICIVGDPSTAKSQFLKYIHGFLPRCVYTSGKATSAAGLTASVQRDPETGEFTIEAGALMLADNGICCCDEFDKMDEKDQVAIHEAMEQQTISITKAGIQATLNARTSVLAAANPIMGRYDQSKSLRGNLNISAPLMSRFDLFYVVIDSCEESTDKAVARHIIHTHQRKLKEITPPFTMQMLQRYIRFARRLKPQITKDAALALRQVYVELRTNDKVGSDSSYKITVRQLESLIRLSEARARVDCSMHVTIEHVKEAARLLNTSIHKVHKPDFILDNNELVEETNAKGAVEAVSQKKGTGMDIENKKDQSKPKVDKISGAEYERLANMMIGMVKKNERNNKELSDYVGMPQNELIEKVVASNLKEINSMEELDRFNNRLKTIISRLIKVEKMFTVVEEDEDPLKRKLHTTALVEEDFGV